jgi:integrase
VPKHRRRLRGEGTIVHRKDGRFVARVEIAPLNGKRRQRFAYARTRQDAIVALERLRAQVAKDGAAKANPGTVGAFFTRWLEQSVKPRVRVSTYKWYEQAYRVHIKPYWHDTPLERIDHHALADLYHTLEQEGVSPRGRQRIHATLRRAFGQAERWDLIDKNPTRLVDAPRYRAPQIHALTLDQIGAFLAACRDDRLEALYTLAVYCGLRQGELFGLQWDDLDLAAGELRVRRTISDSSGKLEAVEPKTRGSRRVIVLPKPVLSALVAHRKKSHSPLWVFTDSEGNLLRRSNLERRSFFPLLERAGLPRIRFHDLRHSAATMLLSMGVHPKVVAEMLGHARVTMTMDVYAHVLPSMQRGAIDLVNRELAKRGKNRSEVQAGVSGRKGENEETRNP